MTDPLRQHLADRLVSLFDRHKVVVWHDDSGALEPLLRECLPRGVQCPQFAGNPLSLRQAIDREDPWLEQKWLLYVAPLPEGVTCDWLEDYGQGFCTLPQANLAGVLSEFFSTPETAHLRAAMRMPAAKTLAMAFGQYFPGGHERLDESEVTYGLLRAAIETPAATEEDLVLRYLASDTDAERWRAQGLLPLLTMLIRSRLGLKRHLPEGHPPDRGALARCLVASVLIEDGAAGPKSLTNHLSHEDFRPRWGKALRHGLGDPARRAKLVTAIEEALQGSDLLTALTDPLQLARSPSLPALDARILDLLLSGRPTEDAQLQSWRDQVAGVAQARLKRGSPDDRSRIGWAALRDAAILLRLVGERLAALTTYPAAAFDRLASEYVQPADGDWRIDRLYRSLPQAEAAVPPVWRELLLEPAKHAYHRFCRELVGRYVKAAEEKGTYRAEGFLRQTEFWRELVDGRESIAVLLADALRADLAYDLEEVLRARGLRVEPKFALAELPSRTAIGMTALLPRAHDDFAVRAVGGRVVASIGLERIPGTDDRTRYLERVLSQQGRGVCREEIEGFLRQDGRLLSECRADKRLPVASTRDLDEGGDTAAAVSFEVFTDVLEKCADFVEGALARGFAEVVVATDHGFLLRDPDAAPGGLPGPEGDPARLARGLRYAVGTGEEGAALTRLSAKALDRAGDDVFVPSGAGCLAIQGGSGLFVHGGLSPQECALVFLRVLPAPAAPVRARVPVRLEVPERATALVVPVSIVAEAVPSPLFVGAREVTLVAFDASRNEVWRTEGPIPVNPSGVTSVTRVLVTLPSPGDFTVSLYDVDREDPLHTSVVHVEALGGAFGF